MSSPRPHFYSSLIALAELALKETRATGYALFLRTNEATSLIRIGGLGDEISATTILEATDAALISIPLRNDGLAAFSFTGYDAAAQARPHLVHVSEAMETIWHARHPGQRYTNLLTRLGTLEAQLIDSKIVDRARGLLSNQHQPEPLDAMARHVKTVFRPGPAVTIIESLVKELEDELKARRITTQAKAVLQNAYSLTEEQAHAHLRSLSRKSRRRLKDIALDVISNLAAKTNAA